MSFLVHLFEPLKNKFQELDSKPRFLTLSLFFIETQTFNCIVIELRPNFLIKRIFLIYLYHPEVLQDVFQVIGDLVKHIFKGALAPITKKRTTMSKVRPIFSPIISFLYKTYKHTHSSTNYVLYYLYLLF